MKKHLFILTSVLFCTYTYAVKVTVSNSINNTALKNKIENNASILLTEFNRAYSQNAKDLDFRFSLQALPEEMKRSLGMLWAAAPFKCSDENITEILLNSNTGYQIRNIRLDIKPKGEDIERQEAVIKFDNYGNIASFHITIPQNQYKNIQENGQKLNDLEKRHVILDYVEQFRTAYNEKNIDFIEQVLSDDALIITGTVIKKATKDGIKLPDEIKYNIKDKKRYLADLKKTFHTYSFIRVEFDNIEIVRHPDMTYSNYYGVKLHQRYRSDRYSDKGYVFLLWRFPKEGEGGYPQIYVRTWQPDMLNNKPLPKKDQFDLNSFDGYLR